MGCARKLGCAGRAVKFSQAHKAGATRRTWRCPVAFSDIELQPGGSAVFSAYHGPEYPRIRKIPVINFPWLPFLQLICAPSCQTNTDSRNGKVLIVSEFQLVLKEI
jgi:hypothetical protein